MEISVGILFPNNLMHALLTSGDTPNEECLVVGEWSAGGFSPRLGFGHQSAPRQSVLWHEFGGCNYTWPLSSPYVHILSLWCTDLCLVSTPRTCDTVVGNALSNLPGCASLHYLNNLYVLQILSYAITDGRLWEKPLCYVRSSGVHPFLRNIPMLLHLDLMRHSQWYSFQCKWETKQRSHKNYLQSSERRLYHGTDLGRAV